jgi:2-haloacid dehalogenase
LKAFVFDAYGTLFDVFSVQGLCEALFPGHGKQLAEVWRKKQLEYSWLRSLMGRYRDFWAVTQDALEYSARSLNLEISARERVQLMDSYLHLTAFPDVKPGLEQLRQIGLRLAILSNGEPKMLRAAVESAGLSALIDVILSVDSMKVFKPSPLVYDRLPYDLEIDKSEIGFVSSNNWDVQGAGSAGFTTFWIQRSGSETSEELGYSPNHVVSAVTDLSRLIRIGEALV